MLPEEAGGAGFTLRSVIIAILLTVFLLVVSSYIALRIGALPWPIIFSAVAAGALLQIFAKINGKTNRHEMNVAQAGGTVGGLLASGVVFTIPGILYLQNQGVAVSMPGVLSLAAVCVTAGVLGVLLSVPMRRVFVDQENLPYPSGTAGAEVIKAETRIGKGTFFLAMALSLTGIFVLLRELYFPAGWVLPLAPEIGLTLALYPMPLAVGIGYLLGPKASVNSWFGGSFIGWMILIPLMASIGFASTAEGAGIVQNAGMGMVIGAGIGFFASYVIPRSGKIFRPLFQFRGSVWYTKSTPLFSIIAFVVLWLVGIHPVGALIAVLGVWIMVSVAAMMTGETDIDPLEQFGIIIGLLAIGFFGLVGLQLDYLSAFMIVAFVSIASAIAGDIGHDYKSAKILGTRAKDIIKVDLIAVIIAALLAPFVLNFIMDAYGSEFFTPAMPAPQAQLVAGSIFGFAHPWAFYTGFIIAFVWVVLENLAKRRAPILPMVFGIGLFLGLVLGILLAIGGLIRYFSDKKYAGLFGAAGIITAAGVMGGEGIAGLGHKAMLVAGIGSPLSAGFFFGVFGLVLLGALALRRRMFS
ncbi:MAG: OPT/YSL family transporter [Candidatus Aenigmatarchaeota archaeon]|nr:MAG: OPT/YSL family transporter [Candidatus Aenigmarchaeota archaeon]